MDQVESQVQVKRSYYRKRRNLIRNIFLIVFIFFFAFVLIKFYKSLYVKEIHISIENNKISNVQYLKDIIANKSLNIFLPSLSTRMLSYELLEKNKLLEKVIIRKYFFPSKKIIAYLLEKNIWAKLMITDKLKKMSLYLTDDGCALNPEILDESKIKQNITLVYSNSLEEIASNDFIKLKNAVDRFKSSYRLNVGKVTISEYKDLEFLCEDKILIKAGRLDDDLIPRISKIESILNVVNEYSNEINFLDLTLENSIVYKKQ